LFAGAARLPKDESRYAALGLAAAKKTVMLPIAPWAMGSALMFNLDEYYPRLVERVVDGLDAHGAEVELVIISLFRPPSLTLETKGPVTVRYLRLLPYDSYDHLLRSCDAIVSDNIIQTSVSKAVVMGTPHLIVQNMAASELPYRCNMFPMKLLFPSDREYARSVDVAEYGDPEGICEKLGDILKNGHSDQQALERRRAYVSRLRTLSDPGAMLEKIIGKAEPRRTTAV
jgi:hypothetical protein